MNPSLRRRALGSRPPPDAQPSAGNHPRRHRVYHLLRWHCPRLPSRRRMATPITIPGSQALPSPPERLSSVEPSTGYDVVPALDVCISIRVEYTGLVPPSGDGMSQGAPAAHRERPLLRRPAPRTPPMHHPTLTAGTICLETRGCGSFPSVPVRTPWNWRPHPQSASVSF